MTRIDRRLDPGTELSETDALALDTALLNELEPEAHACTTATPRWPRSGSRTSTSRTASVGTSTRSRGRRTSRG